MSKITYTNKTALYENNDIADINKVKADDMNEIKACVNNNDDMLTGGAVAGDMIVNSIKTKNLFNEDGNRYGFVIASNGSFSMTANFCYSDFIAVKPSTQYTISLSNGFSGDPMRIAEYTSTKTFIDRPITAGSAPWTFTTPSNCYYIRLSYQYLYGGNRINTNIQLEEGTTATTYTPFQNLKPYSNNYATEEIVVGQWITGKPIYRKVIDFGALPNATTKQVDTNITNGVIVKAYGVANYTSNNATQIPLPYVDPSTLGNSIMLIVREYGTKAEIKTTINYTAFNAYVILEYIKTTD